MTAPDAARRHEMGVDRIMWGADYPHEESTWPDSRASLGTAVKGIPEGEVRQMLGGTPPRSMVSTSTSSPLWRNRSGLVSTNSKSSP
jgi:hypothetical protein